ncbi:amino acid adenylation domain-containing protein [Catenulispora sp. MAP12-49]|uniref:AMP-binding protein n=1 Tax=Catenulispora sp. MAP12-49 TaxID=3156302 RepID=UPI003516785E
MTDPAYRDTPATEVQQGLWLLRALGQEPAPRWRSYRVVGGLDAVALTAAWRALVDRYEALRSALVLRDGVPVRRVWARGGRPDPACAQMTIIRRGPEEYHVRLTVPIAFADEDFLDTLVDELSELCELRAGRGPRTVIGTVGIDGQDAEKPEAADDPEAPEAADDPEALAWWVNALTPLPSELPLPADRPRPERASGRWGSVSAPADPELGRAVAHCAEASSSSASVVMLTAFQVLLHRYTGGDRVAVAVPVSQGRPGAPANVLILPADIAPGQSFKDVLERGTTLAAEAMARRRVPLARVLGALPVVREVRRVPLGDVVFDYRERPQSVLALPGAVVELYPQNSGPAPADLVLRVDDGGSGPAVTVLYDADQFEPATAAMMLRQFRTLLRHAGRAPDTAVGELTLDGPAEAARAAVEADRRADDGAPGFTIVEAVRRRATQDPDALAVDGHDGTLTYRALHAAALEVAEDLRAAGVRSGDAVVVRMPVGVRQYAALLGVLAAGAHLSWFGVADSGERGRVVVGALKPAAMLVAGAAAADSAGADELVDWYRESIGGRVVAVEAPDPAPDVGAAPPELPAPSLADRAYVAFTSGTTGVPKGIAHSHAALAQFAAWMAAEFEIGPGVRVAQWVAAEHDPALAETFAALGAGATLCPVPEKTRANPERLLDWLAAERIGVLQTVPSFGREVLRVLAGRHRADGLGALRVLLLMGEALPGELAEGLMAALPLVRVANLYGPTETVAATWHPVQRRAVGPVPIGRAIPGRGVLVVDESDRVCPAGVTGELVVTGSYVADGYLAAADQIDTADPDHLAAADHIGTAHAAFKPLPGIDAPCYRTGDLARRRPDGALEYRGRKDSQVKLYGNRLELTDVEAALSAHPTVAECAVVAGADRDGLAVRLVVCVVPRRGPGGEPLGAPDQWRTHLRRRFGRALLPALYRTLERLPRTVTGKVDRPRLARTLAAAERDAAARRPAAGTEAELAAIWAALLGAPPEHADQGFFAVGGTSLLVPRLLHEVRERLAAEVTAAQFYAHQSLAALAALIDRCR